MLALFGTGGLATLLYNALQASPDPKYQAVAGVLLAVGVLLKSFISTPAK